jgi:hypothetical protein
MDIGFNGDCDCPLDRLIHVRVSRKDEFQTLGWRQCTSDPERYPTQTRPCGGHSVSRLKSAQSYKAAPTSTSTISAMKSSAAFFEMSLTTPEVASISGHRDIRMLMRYAHPMRQRIIEQMDKEERHPKK